MWRSLLSCIADTDAGGAFVLAIDPSSGLGPLYFTPQAEPDPKRHETSTWSSGLFANVRPGEVQVTLARPGPIACAPSYGGWPSDRPNTVRVPIAAGFETRVTVQCQ